MSTELKIEKFKRVYEPITLKNFDFINYFVGENGSGKTSILNAISYLRDGGNSRHFLSPESVVNFQVDEKKQYLYWNNDNPNKTEDRGDLNPNIYLLLSNQEQEKGANGLSGKSRFDTRLGVGNAQSLDEFNSYMQEMGLNEVTAKKFIDQSDPFNQDNGRLIFESPEGNISPEMIADGLTVFFNLRKTLYKWQEQINSSNSISFIIIEEPENNLHPKFQKTIPILLNDFFVGLNEEVSNKVYFFISTHSPFIISSSANYINQKVFPLKNGKPLKIDFSTQSWEETNYSEGYAGSECAAVVSQMLGADITDIGYPENYCVLEEYSLQIILDSARKKGIIKNIQFVSASGVSKSVDLSETIYELEKLNTLIKCNPYYFDKYLLIIDNADDIVDENLQKRIESIRRKLESRFIELELPTLEDYYSNLDEELAATAKKEIEENSKSKQGILKAKFAEKISNSINDSETFSALFNNELDILLKNYS
ncbi:AAA family ATPase [Nonlabens marinus]|uniref:Endonuclease GajA/Old nuclease/RecF-like AAA domain-containing protein n=1 Tax=Nonlabens marinus S1-08 TaxID=1454201 RepID=W8VZX2_9FLAO|nr:AAA family ATPase [Nonlabens marinus]BAO55321.1 hypothetical protein NMS_1312 [Nonlabens marinus S1-08]